MFKTEHFCQDVLAYLKKKENNEIAHLKMYLQIFKTVLKRHAPMKKNYIQANHGPLMSKTLRKNYILRNKT